MWSKTNNNFSEHPPPQSCDSCLISYLKPFVAYLQFLFFYFFPMSSLHLYYPFGGASNNILLILPT